MDIEELIERDSALVRLEKVEQDKDEEGLRREAEIVCGGCMWVMGRLVQEDPGASLHAKVIFTCKRCSERQWFTEGYCEVTILRRATPMEKCPRNRLGDDLIEGLKLLQERRER